jgi:hypothetical protein
MTDEPRWHPDLLRRFVATPYIFSRHNGSSQIRVESNDLEIALTVRLSSTVQRAGNRAGGFFCKLIRDMASPMDSSEMLVVSDGALRILQVGRSTILIHDSERAELLGFISPSVKVQDLVSSLIPKLLGIQSED